ncbi:MAG: hypothetical protein HQ581_00620, partial [Planctomycetes bacterium]|nr:hypothetical protein [Planctomycetota bacterium]
ETSVERLSLRCPAGVPPAKWDDVVGRTHNAVCINLYLPGCVQDMPRYHRFADELEERLKGDVDMATIDWMWEEYVEIAVNGQRYSDDYRPTGP